MRKKIFLSLAVIFGLVGAGDAAGVNSENEFIQQARGQAARAQVSTAAAIMVSNYGDLQSPAERRLVNKLFELFTNVWDPINKMLKLFTKNGKDPILELLELFSASENVELLGCDPGMDGVTDKVKVFLRGKQVDYMNEIFEELRKCTVEEVTLEEFKRPRLITPFVRSKYEGDVPNYGGSFKRTFEITERPYSFDSTLEAIETRTFRGKRAILRLFYFIINEYARKHGGKRIPTVDGISTYDIDVYNISLIRQSWISTDDIDIYDDFLTLQSGISTRNIDIYKVFSTLQSLFKFN